MGIKETAYERLRYLLSLPERSVRALAALAAGTTSLLTDTLLPDTLRGTKTYQVSIGMMQRYIIERVALMETEFKAEQPVAEDFVQRKMVGTVLETAGLFMVGASPLWVFAILSDVSGGSKVFLRRLVAHLQAHQVIQPGQEFSGVVDVLDAVQQASQGTATAIDMPPLSRADLQEMVSEIGNAYMAAFRRTVELVPTMESIWTRVERLAGGDRAMLDRLLGMMTVDAIDLGRRGSRAVAAAGAAGIQLLDEQILRSYQRTLTAVSRKGVGGYLQAHYRPFFRAAGRHFDSKQLSWTERSLRGD